MKNSAHLFGWVRMFCIENPCELRCASLVRNAAAPGTLELSRLPEFHSSVAVAQIWQLWAKEQCLVSIIGLNLSLGVLTPTSPTSEVLIGSLGSNSNQSQIKTVGEERVWLGVVLNWTWSLATWRSTEAKLGIPWLWPWQLIWRGERDMEEN